MVVTATKREVTLQNVPLSVTALTANAMRIAGVPAADAAFKRGVEYLLRTQQEDGSWYVKSRAMTFQPYFESGFPHGRDQFISAAATSWAAIALASGL